MPKFQVLRRVEAVVDYVAEIDASDPEEAAEIAREDEEQFKWKREGMFQFDDRTFVTLDEHGVAIESTEKVY